MAYIGKSIESGTFSVLDTSGNTYNGSNTAFNLGTQVGSVAQLLVSHDGVIQKPGTDYTLSSGGTAITFSTAPASGASIFIVEISGAVGGPLDSDLNGTELILDADGDTSLHASTDDQIDVKIAGADDFKFTANTFTANSGSSIVVPDGGLTFGSTAIASTAAELNIVDGNTSATSTTLADADRVVVNDAGTMKQVAMTDVKTYVGGGDVVKIASQTISSTVSTIDFTSVFSATYKNYMVVFSQIEAAATAETLFQFKVGGTAQTASSSNNDYNWVNEGRHINNGDNDGQQAGTNSFRIHGDNNSYQDTDISFTMMIFNPLLGRKKRVIAEGVFTNASEYLVTFNMSGEHSSTATNFDGFRFLRSSNDFTAGGNGTVTLYGLVS